MQRYCGFLIKVYVKEARDDGDLHVRTGLPTELSPNNASSCEKLLPEKKAFALKTNIQQVREDYLILGTGNLAPRNWLKSRHSHHK